MWIFLQELWLGLKSIRQMRAELSRLNSELYRVSALMEDIKNQNQVLQRSLNSTEDTVKRSFTAVKRIG